MPAVLYFFSCVLGAVFLFIFEYVIIGFAVLVGGGLYLLYKEEKTEEPDEFFPPD